MAKISLKYKYNDNNQKFYDKILKNVSKIVYEINEIMAKDQYEHAQQICKDAIDTWYGSYGPLAYERKYSLYNAYDIGIRGDTFVFEIGSDMMGYHHQSNDYVFDITFKQGLHGGPIWRTPIPVFTWPLCGAPVSVSPYEMISSRWDEYLNGIYITRQNQALITVLSKYL